MKKTPEFIYGRILRKYEASVMKDIEKYPSLSNIGEFKKFDANTIKLVESKIEINREEIPILLCKISDETWALITTQNLISFKDGIVSQISAHDSEGCWPLDSKMPPIKKEGAISTHVAKDKKGNSIELDLPTGTAAIAFQGAFLVLSRLQL